MNTLKLYALYHVGYGITIECLEAYSREDAIKMVDERYTNGKLAIEAGELTLTEYER
jgi:hypothetical protein